MGELLRETASKFPDNEALVSPEFGVRETYSEFLDSCTKIAKGFMALGVERGDRVSVWSTNVPQWIQLQFALGMIGAVLVTVNTNCEAHELEYILNQSDSTTLIHIEAYRKKNYSEIVREVVPEVKTSSLGNIRSEKLPFLRNVVHMGEEETEPGTFKLKDIVKLGETVSDEELRNREQSLDADDVVNMQYTSGTTGFPKGVMLTHYNIINNARMVGDTQKLTEADRVLIQVPLFHCLGCVCCSLNSVVHGSTMVVLESFNPLKALQMIEGEKCTSVTGVPTMFIATLNHQDFNKFDLSSMRTGIMAGAPCPEDAMRDVMTKMHCPEVTIAYGMTEAAPVITMTSTDDPLEARVSTVGRLLDGIEGKVIDSETGKDALPGKEGELVSRGSCVMKGYYKMDEATEGAIDSDGWLHSGDLATVDEDGYFKITGRIKDLIIRGGENISPREIEDFLRKNSKVKDVYVVGVPDDTYGEQILASISLKDNESATAEEFESFCTDKIARFKIPKYWEFNAPLPLTASGKVQKFKLAKEFMERNAK